MSQNDSFSEQQIVRQLKISFQLPDILKNIQTDKIIKDTAELKQIVLTESELQQFADNFRLQNNLVSAEATFKWLEKHSLSTEDFETLINNQALKHKLAHVLFADRAEAYFYEHKLEYKKAVIYEIVLPQFELALELFYGIKEREFSFWDIAHQYIKDPELRRRGGYKGYISRDDLKPEISAAVFAVKHPQLLKPIRVGKQAHLVYVEEIIESELNEDMRRQIIKDLFTEWLNEQLDIED